MFNIKPNLPYDSLAFMWYTLLPQTRLWCQGGITIITVVKKRSLTDLRRPSHDGITKGPDVEEMSLPVCI